VLLLADDSEEGTAYSSGACEFIPMRHAFVGKKFIKIKQELALE
jgi:hypothetical protein